MVAFRRLHSGGAAALALALALSAAAHAEIAVPPSPNKAGWMGLFPDPQHMEALALERGVWEIHPYLHYSSHYAGWEDSPEISFFQYAETLSLYLNLKVGLTRRLTLDWESSFHRSQSNAMRKIIHESQNTAHYYWLYLDGEKIYERRRGDAAAGDSALGLSVLLREKTPKLPRMTLRFFAEIPTGDAERGFGNGDFDFGATLDFSREWARGGGARLALHGVLPGDMERTPRLDTRPYFGASAGLDAPLPRKWSGLGGWREGLRLAVHAWWNTSPMASRLGAKTLDGQALGWLLGFSWRAGARTRLEGSFMEDAGSGFAQTQDYAMGLGLRRRMGRL
jgi:hypothetical protein